VLHACGLRAHPDKSVFGIFGSPPERKRDFSALC
jgi:hypothetical protein